MARIAPPMSFPFPVRLLSVTDYHRMIDANILNETDAVELIEGWIVPKMPRKPPHDSALDRLEELLRGLLPAGWRLRGQKAITLAESEPEPDAAVVRGPVGRYDAHHPGPAEVGLVAEVSESSGVYDRTVKLRMYARNGIPVYWVVNLPARRVEVYTDPASPPDADPVYRTRTDYGPADSVPVVVAGAAAGLIPVAAILP